MESSRASGSGGIERRSRAGGDGVEVEVNVLNNHTVMFTTVNLFLRTGMWFRLSHLFYQYIACNVITVVCAWEL